MQLGSLLTSPNLGRIRPRVDEMLGRLSTVHTLLEDWVGAQGLARRLKAAFITQPEIPGGRRLRELPRTGGEQTAALLPRWDKMMKAAAAASDGGSGLCEVCLAQQHALPELRRRLEACQKQLDAYVDAARSAFPMLFFISIDELLYYMQLHATSAAPGAAFYEEVYRVCSKCFAGLEAGGEAVPSSGGGGVGAFVTPCRTQRLELLAPISLEQPAQVWLPKLAEACRQAVRRDVRAAAVDVYQTPPDAAAAAAGADSDGGGAHAVHAPDGGCAHSRGGGRRARARRGGRRGARA